MIQYTSTYIFILAKQKKCYNQNSIKQIFISNKSKMFNLCKTIKIYQTINHYHLNPTNNNHSIDSHQIKYSETNHPSTIDTHPNPNIQITEVHGNINKRHGISLSIKNQQQHNSLQNKRILLSISKKDFLRASKTNVSELSSLKMKSTQRFQCEQPKIIESKITYGSTSPRLKPYDQSTQCKKYNKEQELFNLPQIPLKRQITRTTHASIAHQSVRNSQPQILQEYSPLKRSTNFLRISTRNKIDDNMKNSIEINIRNNAQSKMSSLNSSKIKKQQNSQSLLKLSCSSYSQILQKPNNTIQIADSLSQTYSLQLKKEESFFRQYGNDISRSIILGKVIAEKQMKNVKSNYDLMIKDANNLQMAFKPTKSDILERDCPSPTLTRLKNFYGHNLLNFYDQETIVSKSFVSRSNESKEKKHIIDESIILQHVIEDKFSPIMNKVYYSQGYKMFLAREQQNNLLISIKEIPIESIQKINQQITIYKEMQSKNIQVPIHQLYQVYIHGNIYILVKQPYQYTCKEFIQKHLNKNNQRQVNIFIKNVQDSLRKIISILFNKGIYLCKFITIEDIVITLGDWKCHSPDMFTSTQGQETSIPIEQALQYIKEDILNCFRKNHLCK